MNLTGFYRSSSIVLAVMAIVTAWGFSRVGFDVQVPIHWNVNGEEIA